MRLKFADSGVEALAIFVDELCRDDGRDFEPVVAIARERPGREPVIVRIPLPPGPGLTLSGLPSPSCIAACLSVIGTRTRLDTAFEDQEEVRTTVAVSCCQTAVVTRLASGRRDCSSMASGPIVELLKGWAALSPCAACREQVDRPTLP